MKTMLFTIFSLIAFAGNSVLCRLALAENEIDAGSFTVIRLISGTVMLCLCIVLANRSAGLRQIPTQGSWTGSALLFVYALSFSYAYITLDTGTGALILFGAVQIFMVLFHTVTGHRILRLELLGMVCAMSGFVYLMLPDASSPSLNGFLLMLISGLAWAGYTLKGRNSSEPLQDTAGNFFRTIPFVLLLLMFSMEYAEFTIKGVVLAVLSGALASGLGYAVWYRALEHLGVLQAAVLQLLVPVIAAIGGVLFADEAITLRLTYASVLVLGGIVLVIVARKVDGLVKK
ncbi:DMT family transporter [Litoribacillus peritrichatus]|uniref:DMT family transporter n=1 Tax=Litoribacillus peritrichatus TaxID=718191 RepID=A0ABP7MDA2_9GAMM